MNATNRVLNRGLLLVVGIVLAAAGAALIIAAAAPVWFAPVANAADRIAREAMRPTVAVTQGADAPVAAIVAAAVALVLSVLLVVFVATRGGGRTATVVRDEAGAGATEVDRSVAEAVLGGALRERSDVLSAGVASYRVKRSPAIRLAVRCRRGADVARVLRAAEAAVGEWDALAGTDVPVIVHVTDRRWTDRWRSATRVR